MALAALLALTAALLASTGRSDAQSCSLTEDLGMLRSHQTITRTGLLNSSSCRLDGVRYYDSRDFQLAGAGEVRINLRSQDFRERVALNTVRGEFLAAEDYEGPLVRTLPAGRYRVSAISNQSERAGSYTLTIRTGQLAAPPPPPPPPQETTTDDEEEVVPPDEAEVVRGHVIARVHPLPENDRRGRYRIEFGFLSAEVLASGTDRTAVVDANVHLLPPRRYLNEASLLARGRANDRRWLRSDPVDVLPMEGDDAGLSGEPLLTGRVIARWNPTPGGRFRVEFGFLPDWAFEAACDDTERAAELYAELLPEPGRYLTENRLNGELRRDQPRWLTSSAVEVGEDDGTTPSCNGPIITPAGVPITLAWGERIADVAIATIYGELAETFTPVVVEGLPPGLTYDVEESRADGREYQVTVSGTIPPQTPVRTYSVAITAEGAVGDPATETVLIKPGPPPLLIEWLPLGYNPATTSIGGSVGIVQPRVTSPFPAPPGVTWSFETRTTDVCSVNSRTGALTLIGAGACQVTVTASAPGYKPATATAQVTVDPTTPCTISWSGYNPASVELGDAAPTILAPLCMVNGRVAYPEYRYSVAPASAGVCRVNEATGALTIMSPGECRILLTNVAKPPEYGVGSAEASVTVGIGTINDLRWQGYTPNPAQLRGPAPRLLQPTTDVRPIEFSYSSLTPSVCGVDRETGALTLVREGNCIVRVSTSGNPDFGTATKETTVVVGGTGPTIDSITCSPLEPQVGDSVTCRAQLSGGEPDEDGWLWIGGDSSGSDETYRTRFDSAGAKTVWLTVRNSAGSDRESTAVIVRPEPPVIDSIDCDPPRPSTGDTVTCTAQLSGGEPDEWLWIGGSGRNGEGPTFTPTFDASGRHVVWLSVSNSAGSDTDSITVDPPPPPPEPPVISSISCPSSAEVDENITCTVRLDSRGGTPTSYSWSGGDSSGRDERYRTSFSSPGAKTVRLTVSNSAGDDSDRARIDIEDIEDDNRDPECRPIDSVTLAPNNPWSVYAECTDPDNDPITLRVRPDDTSVANDRSTEYPWVRIQTGRAGTTVITVTATDGRGGSGSVRFTVTVRDRIDPPRDVEISCSPRSIDEGESVTCEVTRNRGGRIDTYAWSASGGQPSSGSSSTYSPSFSSEGRYTVRLTARNDGGDDADSATVRVERVPPPVDPPRISISCTARVLQGDSASCRVSRNRGGDIDRYSWSATGGASSGSSSTYRPSFSSYGRQTVRLTASNDGGSDSDSLPVDVVPRTTWTYARCGSDTIRVYWFNSTNLTKHWLNMTWEEVSIRVSGWGEHLIGRLSQAECNSWPDGRVITYVTW